MENLYQPVVLELPLRGEWAVPNTPGTRIPSHGTNMLGTRYAYDFLKVDWKRKGNPCYSASPLRYLLSGLPTDSCYCYGQSIYAPCDGTVIAAANGCPERKKLRLLPDIRLAKKTADFSPIKTMSKI